MKGWGYYMYSLKSSEPCKVGYHLDDETDPNYSPKIAQVVSDRIYYYVSS